MKIAFIVLASMIIAEIIVIDIYPPFTIRQFKSHIVILVVLSTLWLAVAYGIMRWTK